MRTHTKRIARGKVRASFALTLLVAVIPVTPRAEADEPRFGPGPGDRCGTLGVVPDGPAHPKCERWKSRYKDAANGRNRAFDVTFSPDGSRVFVTGEAGYRPRGSAGDAATVAYDASSGEELWAARYDAGGAYDTGFAVAASPDGSRVFVAGNSGPDLLTLAYDAVTGARVWASHHDAGSAWDLSYDIAVSPDGSRVFTTGRMIAFGAKAIPTVAHDAATGAKLWVSLYAGPAAVADNGTSIAVGPLGDVVYVVGESHNGTKPEFDSGGLDLVVLAYDADLGHQLWATRYDSPSGGQDSSAQLVSALEVSPDGTRLYVIGNSAGTASIDYLTLAIDAASGALIWQARYDGPAGGHDSAWAVGLSRDASTVFVTGESAGAGSTDAATVAYAADSGQRLWEARYDGQLDGWDRALSLAVVSDGTSVVIGGQSNIVQLPTGFAGDMLAIAYDVATGAELWNETYNGTGGDSDGAVAIAASPVSPMVASTGWSAAGPPPIALGVTDTSGVLPYWDFMTLAYDVSIG